jgi:hypothetical protein
MLHGGGDDAEAVTSACASYVDQYWRRVWDSAGAWYQWKNFNSGKCLVGRSVDTVPVQYTCGTWADQWWRAY